MLVETLYFIGQLLWTLKSMPLGTTLILWPLLKTQWMTRYNEKGKILMEEVIAWGTVIGSLEIPYTCKHLTGLSMAFVSVFVSTWRLSSVQHLIILVWSCWRLSWRKVSFSFSLSQNEHKFSFFWIDGLLQNALPISTFLQIFFIVLELESN